MPVEMPFEMNGWEEPRFRIGANRRGLSEELFCWS
jgi:hypothetical protein